MSEVDFTPQELALIASVGTPKTTAKAGWTVNSLELGKACEQLGLQLTVMVKLTNGINKHGGAGLRRRGNKAWHHVKLSQLWNKERANFTLWHELAHCWQKEQWAKETGDSLFQLLRQGIQETQIRQESVGNPRQQSSQRQQRVAATELVGADHVIA